MYWPCCCGLCPWSFAQYCPSNPLLHQWEWRLLERTTITAVTEPNRIWATNRWWVWKRGYNAQSRATLTSEKVPEDGIDLDTYSLVLHVKFAFSRLLYKASTSRWQYIGHQITQYTHWKRLDGNLKNRVNKDLMQWIDTSLNYKDAQVFQSLYFIKMLLPENAFILIDCVKLFKICT